MQLANPYPSPSPLARHRAAFALARKDAENIFARPPEWRLLAPAAINAHPSTGEPSRQQYNSATMHNYAHVACLRSSRRVAQGLRAARGKAPEQGPKAEQEFSQHLPRRAVWSKRVASVALSCNASDGRRVYGFAAAVKIVQEPRPAVEQVRKQALGRAPRPIHCSLGVVHYVPRGGVLRRCARLQFPTWTGYASLTAAGSLRPRLFRPFKHRGLD
ncbi:hypothetical protein PSPO01_07308 [Paraphaeosphaeria sporulosa]